MAIGASSDQNLENLAKWSNGQTYFIHDGEREKQIIISLLKYNVEYFYFRRWPGWSRQCFQGNHYLSAKCTPKWWGNWGTNSTKKLFLRIDEINDVFVIFAFKVYDQTVSSQTTFTDSFTIDSTLGRDVNIKIGVPQTDLTSNLAFQMQLRNGSLFKQTLKTRTTSLTFPTLEVNINWKSGVFLQDQKYFAIVGWNIQIQCDIPLQNTVNVEYPS